MAFSLLYSLSNKIEFQIRKWKPSGARESKLEIQGFWKPSSSALFYSCSNRNHIFPICIYYFLTVS